MRQLKRQTLLRTNIIHGFEAHTGKTIKKEAPVLGMLAWQNALQPTSETSYQTTGAPNDIITEARKPVNGCGARLNYPEAVNAYLTQGLHEEE